MCVVAFALCTDCARDARSGPADILFTDSAFDPGNNNAFSATSNLGSGVTATYGRCASASYGNPGYGLKVVVTTPSAPGGART